MNAKLKVPDAEKYGFVYIWRDKKHKRYYIGCHWGTEYDGYVCSSKWMYNSYKRRPEDFKRKVLSRIYTNKNDMFQKEHEWLRLIKREELKKKYYNCVIKFYEQSNHPMKNRKHSEETKKKISLKKIGSKGFWTGKKRSKETFEKVLKTKKEKGIKPSFTGKGSKWYTNGIIDKMCFSDNIPDGFYLGRSKNRRQ